MEKLKKISMKLLFPHIALIIIIVIIAIAGLIYAFAYKNPHPVITYLSYFISAYALTIVCARTPKMYHFIKRIKEENKYVKMYTSQVLLRVKISLYISLGMNTLYAFLQLVLGIINHSIWFYALSGYYILLVVMRLFLAKEVRNNKKDHVKELKLYRMCGVVLLFMNIVLSVVMFYIVKQNRGFEYHYIVTIAMAAYTFTTFTLAIINTVRYRKYKSPMLSATKAINLVSAIVSMMSLETAMLTAFGNGSHSEAVFRRIITAASGAMVCTAVLTIAIYMIKRSTKELHS